MAGLANKMAGTKKVFNNMDHESKKFWDGIKQNLHNRSEKAGNCSDKNNSRMAGILTNYRTKRSQLSMQWVKTDTDGRKHADILMPKTRVQRQLIEMLCARSWQLLKGEIDFTDDLARGLFSDLDHDGSGELDLLEFKKLMRIVGMRREVDVARV